MVTAWTKGEHTHVQIMPKAQHTAKLVAEELGDIPIIENAKLGEHSRKSNAPYGSIEDFHNRIRRMFDHPDDLIYGDEMHHFSGMNLPFGSIPD